MLAEKEEFLFLGLAVGEVGEVATAGADGVELGDILGPSQEEGHGAKGTTGEIHIEAGNDDAHACEGEPLDDLANGVVEELGLVYAYDIHTYCEGGNGGRAGNGYAGYAGGIVRDDVRSIVPGIGCGLEDACLLTGYLHTLEPAYELFALAREHAAADNFYPAGLVCMIWLYEHVSW